MAANRPALIAVGGACATGIFRVPEVPPLPAKVIADRMCRVADGMAVSAACAFVKLGGTATMPKAASSANRWSPPGSMSPDCGRFPAAVRRRRR